MTRVFCILIWCENTKNRHCINYQKTQEVRQLIFVKIIGTNVQLLRGGANEPGVESSKGIMSQGRTGKGVKELDTSTARVNNACVAFARCRAL